MTILHIDSSINGAGSASRAITGAIVDSLAKSNWGEPVIYRDATNAKAAGAFDKLTEFYGEHYD